MELPKIHTADKLIRSFIPALPFLDPESWNEAGMDNEQL